jgi:2-polyprenyl-3-methyl-5-hydroxy-6-metoxy-1,4-benzoquinol methylase
MITLLKYDERIPAWDFNKLNDRVCPFCRTTHFERKYLRPDGLAIALCVMCDTHFVTPSPCEEELNKFYNSYYKHHAKIIKKNNLNIPRKINLSNIYEDVRINVLCKLIKFDGSRVLDVGCGSGEFLANLKHLGAITTGIDLSSEAVKAARINGVNNVLQISISDFQDYDKYDLIVLNDIIEHPLDPLILIEKVKSLLKIGGLLMIWTPNGDNIKLDIEKKALRVDLEHMQYLGSKGCKKISGMYNFDILHYESLGFCTYSPNFKKNKFKKVIIYLLKIFNLFQFARKIYTLLKFKGDRQGNYHLFIVFKNCI